MARHSSSPGIADRSAAPVERAARIRRSAALNLLISLRPGQWPKNLLIFAGLIFGQRLFDPTAVRDAVAAFAIFCGLSGAVYLVNDVADREHDRQHPHKSKRPIASGAIGVPAALAAAAGLVAASLAGAFVLGGRFAAVSIAYVVLLGLYSAV